MTSLPDDWRSRRIVRLLQVREQSKRIAERVRRRVDDERAARLAALEASGRARARRRPHLNHLHRRRDALMLDVGDAYTNAPSVSSAEWKLHKEIMSSSRPTTNIVDIKNVKQGGIKKKYSEVAERESDCAVVPASLTIHFDQKCTEPLNIMSEFIKRRNEAQFMSSCKRTTDVKKDQPDGTKKKQHESCQFNSAQNKGSSSSTQIYKKSVSDKNPTFQGDDQSDIQFDEECIKPLNIVSELVKKKNKSANALDQCPRKNDHRSDQNVDLTSVREVIQQSRHLNVGERSQIASDPAILNPFSKWSNRNRYSKLPRRNAYGLSASNVRKYKSEVRKNLKRHRTHWQTGRKHLEENEKFIESYDHNNRFLKNIAVNDGAFVKKMPTNPPNAYQLARQELDRRKREALLNDQRNATMREHAKKAFDKIHIERDYNKLIQELELISAPKFMKPDAPEMFKKLKKNIRDPVKITTHPPHSTSQNKTMINVASWSAHSSNHPGDPKTDSETSSQSLVFDVLGNNTVRSPHIGDILKLVDDQKRLLMRELMKIKTQRSVKTVKHAKVGPSDVSDSGELSTSSSVDKVTKQKVKSCSLEKINVIDESGNLTSKVIHSVSESSKSSFSFKGLQITINIKKDKSGLQMVTKKDEAIQTRNEKSNSSSEECAKKSEISIEKNVSTKLSNASSDLTESTVYMNLPEKFSSKFLSVNCPQNIAKLNNLDKIIDTDKSKLSSDEMIKKYILQLLEMSKSDINRINVDVSDVPTPSDSVINITSNVSTKSDVQVTEKLSKLKTFIDDNYKLLDELTDQINISKDSEQKPTKHVSTSRPSQMIMDNSKPSTSGENRNNVIKRVDRLCTTTESEKPNKKLQRPRKKSSNIDNRVKSIPKDSAITKTLQSTSITENDPSTNRVDALEIQEKLTLPKPSDLNRNQTFIPFLSSLPKPNIVKDCPTISEQPKPPIGIDIIVPEMPAIHGRHIENIHLIPHELSTIIEVDTPKTYRSRTVLSKNNDSPFRENNLVLKSPEIPNNESGHKHNVLNISSVKNSEVDFKPFISFRDYAANVEDKTIDTTSLSLSEAGPSKYLSDASSKRDNSIHSKEHISQEDSIKIEKALKDISDSDVALEASADFNTWLKSIGLDWAIPTLRKSREVLNLPSSISSTSSTDGSMKINDLPEAATGLSTMSDELDLSDENLLKKIAFDSFTKLTVKNELESLLNKLESSTRQEIMKKKSDSKSTDNKEEVSNNSKDKSQHRTSTPVQLARSSEESSVTHASLPHSNKLFSMESDLSSVKNFSNSDKQQSSDERDALSVPDVTLKFNKLFDFSEKSDK